MRKCFTCSTRFEDQRLVCPADNDVLVYEGKPCADTGRMLNGRYRLGNLLGEGGMGRVFEAERIGGREPVAVKLLKVDLGGAREAAEKRFQVEAEAGAALDHPGIVKVLEFCQAEEGPSYIAMERLYGSTFEDLRRAGKLGAPEHVVDLLLKVCEVLAAAHSRGIVHRDLKPSNLFLHRTGKDTSVVKVLDFGIAKILDRSGERLTSTGEFLGTLLYMAPELTSGHAVTTAADVYSIGVILFEALAGKAPFSARNPMELIRLHASTPAPALSTFRPDVSEELDDLISCCLSKKPSGRFADAVALCDAMRNLKSVRATGISSGTKTFSSNASSWVGVLLDDRYEIHEWMALGRFGSDVYRATHLRTGASVAVRLWRTGKGAVRDCLLAVFRKEATAMSVRHPNIIAILDLGFNDTCVYVVTDLIESISLRDLLARKGALPLPLSVQLVRGAAEGLRALHEKGIVSGGLSPETLRVVTGAGGPEKLLLSPFGLTNLNQLSSLMPRAQGVENGDRSVNYIAPEQAAGSGPDARSDLYSLGLIFLEMLGGRIPERLLPPTRSAEGKELLGAIPDEAPTPPPMVPPHLEPAWQRFFERAIARDPEKRFQDAAAFCAALS